MSELSKFCLSLILFSFSVWSLTSDFSVCLFILLPVDLLPLLTQISHNLSM